MKLLHIFNKLNFQFIKENFESIQKLKKID